ncbi:ASCH domain-containing protein [Mesorhizobium sp. M0678]|uniref:ASCH domain-containing protein n=1 Tax=unclassified Mesorhizobium TaxID=325217 RepID=UPI00333993F2
MAKSNEAIISIRPKFAEAILSGQKTIELRRRIPLISIGTRLWIYATRPVGAVIGSATVKRIIRGLPEEVWTKGGDLAGLDRESFDIYFDGAPEAIGLVLADMQRGRPISIEKLRLIRRGFHPPQVILRISDGEASTLQQLLNAA